MESYQSLLPNPFKSISPFTLPLLSSQFIPSPSALWTTAAISPSSLLFCSANFKFLTQSLLSLNSSMTYMYAQYKVKLFPSLVLLCFSALFLIQASFTNWCFINTEEPVNQHVKIFVHISKISTNVISLNKISTLYVFSSQISIHLSRWW